MLCHDKKCIFIHINKCGGTTIDHFFTGDFSDHIKAARYMITNPWAFERYFKFTIVRNPWDRMVSFYEYQVKRGWDKYEHVMDSLTMERITFNEFIQSEVYFKSMPTQTNLNTNPCLDWIVDDEDNLLVDYIGRFENFQASFDVVCDKLNIDHVTLPKLNSTNRGHYTDYYDDISLNIIGEQFKRDIDYFGYVYGEN